MNCASVPGVVGRAACMVGGAPCAVGRIPGILCMSK